MIVTIKPSKAEGRITAPPSKSMAHRLLICAGLAEGTSVISNVEFSQDILATLDCLRALGAGISCGDGSVTVRGVEIRRIDHPSALSCRECGSTLRFMIPVCLINGQRNTLTGSDVLFSRPLGVYEEICRDQGLMFKKEGSLLTVEGRLRSGDYVVPGNVSSQFISGLLFVLPLLDGDSRIVLVPPVESRPYIQMTIQALEMFGVSVLWEKADQGSSGPGPEPCAIRIPGGQKYRPQELSVEGDYSNAAFFEALNLIGGNVEVQGLSDKSLQGDQVYRRCFEELKGGCPELDLSDCPDLGPVLMALAAGLNGAVFTGTRRLEIKESDRGAAMQQELEKMNARVEKRENEIRVWPGVSRPRETLDGHNDHRIVMALSVLLTKTGGSVRGAEAVAKSLPDFFDRLKKLGIDYSESLSESDMPQ